MANLTNEGLLGAGFFAVKTAAKKQTASNSSKIALFPKPANDKAKELARQEELRDAQRFSASISALLNAKTNAPKSGLFAAPRPTPKPTSTSTTTKDNVVDLIERQQFKI